MPASWDLDLSRIRRIVGRRDDEFRGVSQLQGSSRVHLIAGRADDPPQDWWRSPLDDLVSFLCRHAERLAYAHIARGHDVPGAFDPTNLPSDWPARADYQPHSDVWLERAGLDDLLTPDAFGVMVLGRGFRDRIPEVDGWQIQPIGENIHLLQAVDLDRWFSAPPPGDAQAWAALHDARHAFAPLLYTPQAPERLGL